MSTAASHYWARERSRAPRLRLLRGAESVHAGSPRADESTRSVAGRPALRLMVDPAPVLIAGSDSARRAALIDDLTETMPQSTLFEEASAVSEVLEHAPASRMVILSGDLDDTSRGVADAHARAQAPGSAGRKRRRSGARLARVASLKNRDGARSRLKRAVAWRRAIAAEVLPAAKDPRRLHGQQAGHVVRPGRALLAVFDHTHSALAVAALLFAGRRCPRSRFRPSSPGSRHLRRRSELSGLYFFEAIATAALAVSSVALLAAGGAAAGGARRDGGACGQRSAAGGGRASSARSGRSGAEHGS